MLTKYKIINIGERDAYFGDKKQLIGTVVSAGSSEVAGDGLFSGKVFGKIKYGGVTWGDMVFAEVYLEEI
jgi:hypothetical protein